MAGAKFTMLASALLQKGVFRIQEILDLQTTGSTKPPGGKALCYRPAA
jgi:hypothetical protein